MEQSELTLHQLLRCRHVKRWHIVRVARDQTVAEHSWAVTMIARHLCDRLGLFLSPSDMLMMVEWSLMHDATETVIGDLPTPTSEVVGRWMRDKEMAISTAWGVRHAWASSAMDGLPLEIVKMADIIEAISFLDDDAVGAHAERVELALRARLVERINGAEIRYPRLPWPEAVHQTLNDSMTMNGPSHD